MASDLELFHGGQLQPISPGNNDLTPVQNDWGEVPDYLGTDSSAPTFFGEPVSATEQQLEQLVGELSGGFQMQFSAAGYSQRHIAAAIAWFSSQWDSPPRQEQVRHRYQLPPTLARDSVAVSFANHCAACNAPQNFVLNAISWLEKVAAQIEVSGTPDPAHGRATRFDPDELSDKEYQQFVHINQQAAARSEGILRRKYGQAYTQVVKTANEYLQSLDTASKRHFDQYVTGGVHALNDATIIDNLYQSAIGANNINGASLASEIRDIENLMKTNPKAYFSDQQIQARLLELYRRRDG